MTRKQVIVQLDEGLLGDLDVAARGLGISRSELLRRAAHDYLEGVERAVADQRTIDSYTRHPERSGEFAGGFAADRPIEGP